MLSQKFKFLDKVYRPPFKPFYDKYRGHEFVVKHFHPDDVDKRHVLLECISDPNLKVDGYVHIDDLTNIK